MKTVKIAGAIIGLLLLGLVVLTILGELSPEKQRIARQAQAKAAAATANFPSIALPADAELLFHDRYERDGGCDVWFFRSSVTFDLSPQKVTKEEDEIWMKQLANTISKCIKKKDIGILRNAYSAAWKEGDRTVDCNILETSSGYYLYLKVF